MEEIDCCSTDLEGRSKRSSLIVAGNSGDIGVEVSIAVDRPSSLFLQNMEIVLEGSHDRSWGSYDAEGIESTVADRLVCLGCTAA